MQKYETETQWLEQHEGRMSGPGCPRGPIGPLGYPGPNDGMTTAEYRKIVQEVYDFNLQQKAAQAWYRAIKTAGACPW